MERTRRKYVNKVGRTKLREGLAKSSRGLRGGFAPAQFQPNIQVSPEQN